MSTIPKEIQEEAERRFPNREYNNQGGYTDQEYNILFKQISDEIKQRQQDFIDGYQLATDGREEEKPDFKKELMSLLNRHSKESDSNTPDFILAEHLIGSLKVFCESVNNRNTFYVRTEEPDGREELEKENTELKNQLDIIKLENSFADEAIAELKAENERLKDGLRKIAEHPEEAENKFPTITISAFKQIAINLLVNE